MEKILFISHLFNPFEPFSGAEQRTNLLLRSLSEDYELDVLYFTNQGECSENYKYENCNLFFYNLPNQVKKRKYSYWQIGFIYPTDDFIAEVCKGFVQATKYKYVVFHYISTVYLCGLQNEDNLIIDIDDSPVEQFKTKYSHFYRNKKYLLYIKILLVKFYTYKLIRKSIFVFFSRSNQAKYKNSRHLENIPYPFFVNYRIENNAEKDGPILVFVGAMGYFPNYYGIKYYLDNVWGAVKKQIPEAELRIIGRDLPKEELNYFERFSGVKYLGMVKDLYSEYSKCKAIIVPIYSGAGTNIKVLEGMKTGKPCIISEFSSKGFDKNLIDGENILIAKNDKDYVRKTIDVLSNDKFNKKISQNAKKVIDKNYSYENFKTTIKKAIDYINNE